MTTRVHIPENEATATSGAFQFALLGYHKPHDGAVLVLHIYSPRGEREDILATTRQQITTPHQIRYHTRPWTRVILREHHYLPPIPGTRKDKAARLAAICAFMFTLGVICYHVATA